MNTTESIKSTPMKGSINGNLCISNSVSILNMELMLNMD